MEKRSRTSDPASYLTRPWLLQTEPMLNRREPKRDPSGSERLAPPAATTLSRPQYLDLLSDGTSLDLVRAEPIHAYMES